jgi:hypothetical protein
MVNEKNASAKHPIRAVAKVVLLASPSTLGLTNPFCTTRAFQECPDELQQPLVLNPYKAGPKRVRGDYSPEVAQNRPISLVKALAWRPGCAHSFFVRHCPYRRVKASRRIELGGETSGGPSRQPLILFIALPWTDDKTEPG